MSAANANATLPLFGSYPVPELSDPEPGMDPTVSSNYGKSTRPQPLLPGCKWMHPWMTESRPNCNVVHERAGYVTEFRKNKILGSGSYRDVFRLCGGVEDGRWKESEETIVLKTLRWNDEDDENWYTSRYYDYHRRDAIVSSRLSWSSNVLNVYGHCGQSGLYEYAPHGDLETWVNNRKRRRERRTTNNVTDDGRNDDDDLELLKISIEIVSGLVDLHDMERDGRPSYAHTDLSVPQWVKGRDNKFKLNDFNCGQFLTVKIDDPTVTCGGEPRWSFGASKFRSPEELKYKTLNDVTEKVDVFSLGNVYYVLLTGKWPYEHIKTKNATRLILEGTPPTMPDAVRDSARPAHVALKRVVEWARTYDRRERPTATEVKRYLEGAYANLTRRRRRKEKRESEG